MNFFVDIDIGRHRCFSRNLSIPMNPPAKCHVVRSERHLRTNGATALSAGRKATAGDDYRGTAGARSARWQAVWKNDRKAGGSVICQESEFSGFLCQGAS